jgi:hypothetical protein
VSLASCLNREADFDSQFKRMPRSHCLPKRLELVSVVIAAVTGAEIHHAENLHFHQLLISRPIMRIFVRSARAGK